MAEISNAHVGEATDSSSFAGARRTIVAALALFLLVIPFTIGRSGSALGPVQSITPFEVTSDDFIGFVFEPSMSYRGEVAGVQDREVNNVAFVQLDVAGPDPMFRAAGITVSGDGCVALTTRARPVSVAVILDWVTIDRCTGNSTAVGGVGSAYDRENSIALSHTGRFAAVQIHNTGDVGPPTWIRRIDTQTLAVVDMILPDPFDETLAEHGLDISDDGRFIVVPMQDLQDARIEIAVWDVETGAVSVASDSGPTISTWAAFPSISGDGRWVSFASNRPRGQGEDPVRGPWVYVTDRTTGAVRLISGAAAASYYSSLSRDGSQVAFSVADPPIIILPPITFTIPTLTLPLPPIGFAPVLQGNGPGCDYLFEPITRIDSDCPPTRVNVAFGSSPGLTGGFQVETISLDPNNRRVGNHWEPTLSGNGRWVTWISDVGDALLGTPGDLNGRRHAFTRRRDPGLTVSTVDFGTVEVNGTPPDRTALVRNTGRTSIDIASIAGLAAPFSVVGGSCDIGDVLSPGTSCTVRVRFRPGNTVDSWNDTLTVDEIGYDAISASGPVLGGSTTGPTIPPPSTTIPDQSAGTPLLTASPNPADFGTIDVGGASSAQTITVTNIGDGAGVIGTTLDGPHPADFFVQINNCVGVTLLPTESCTMDVFFIPDADGARSATLTAAAALSSVDIELTGEGVARAQLVADPPAVDYGPVKVGFSTDSVTVTITNTGNGAGTLNTALSGSHPDDFFVRVNNCVNETLEPGDSCTIDIAMFPRDGGNRSADLTVSTPGSSVDVALSGQGRFEPSLMASPEAVTNRGITILVGQGFPPDQPFNIDVIDSAGAVVTSVPVGSDADGRFRESFSPLGKLELGPYTLHIDGVTAVFDPIDEPLVVVLPTFQPQGPTGPAFNNNLLVTRG